MITTGSLPLLDHYGVVILPALVVAEQLGIPLPAMPALVAIGALAADGRGGVSVVLAAAAAVGLTVDLAWYEFGRRCGARALTRLFRFAPDSHGCLRRAETAFTHYGARAMLAAKFVPGLTTIMPPLAGTFAVARGPFIAYDVAGTMLWAGTWLGLGYAFGDAIILICERAARAGRVLGLGVAAVLAGAVLLKYARGVRPPCGRNHEQNPERSQGAVQ